MTPNFQILTSGTPFGEVQSYSNSVPQPVSANALWSSFVSSQAFNYSGSFLLVGRFREEILKLVSQSSAVIHFPCIHCYSIDRKYLIVAMSKSYYREIWALSYWSWKADQLQRRHQEAKCAAEELSPCFCVFQMKKKDWVAFINNMDLIMDLRAGEKKQ